MPLIKYCRCDDRLIHGQIVYKWVEKLKVNKIVIVDDEARNDVIKKGLIKMAAPKDLNLKILSVSEAIRSFFNDECNDNPLVVVSNIKTVQKLIEAEINIEKLNLGRIPTAVGRKKITSNVYLNKRDICLLKNFIKDGVNVVIQMVPDDEEVLLSNYIKEIEGRYSKE